MYCFKTVLFIFFFFCGPVPNRPRPGGWKPLVSPVYMLIVIHCSICRWQCAQMFEARSVVPKLFPYQGSPYRSRLHQRLPANNFTPGAPFRISFIITNLYFVSGWCHWAMLSGPPVGLSPLGESIAVYQKGTRHK